jgi:deoxyribonuclease V
MIALFDVDYQGDKAHVAGVLIQDWPASEPVRIYAKIISGIAPYEPGAFYKRELPCILALLSDIDEPLTCYVIDGYVWLGDKPGLGYHLHQEGPVKVPVIGIAKSRFYNNHKALEVIRGNSHNPLFVTSIGIEVETSAQHVKQMSGNHRLPDLVKLTDQMCRKWAK